MVAYTPLQKSAVGTGALPLPVCGTGSVPDGEPTGVCTSGSRWRPWSSVENTQELCQCCRKNMQLVLALITRRRWITSL